MSTTHAPREFELSDNDLLVLMGDHAGNYIYANDAFLNIRGWTWEQIKGTPTAKEGHDGNPKQVMAEMIVAIRAKKPWSGIYKNICVNGDTYWSRINLSPLFSDRKYAGVLIVHSKPSREEIEYVRPLYARMISEHDNRLVLRNERVIKADAWGKGLMWLRTLGLKARVIGVMLGLAVAGLAGLSLGFDDLLSAPFLAASAGFLAAVVAGGTYLFRTIVLPLRGAVEFANQIASGDLSSQQRSLRSDEIGDVFRALTQMNVSMRATVQDVRQGVKKMTQATTDIATGTQDLSQRTEAQAGNLEETAASMEQMHVTVQHNADTARQASAAAAEASTAAETGGAAVNSVIQTMEGISQSSKRISEIIGVIDGIAFQTNILALNAAVEAARAGDQGRGFAVVAGEVRSLAQRSAQSAKEVRSLISDSVRRVDTGFAAVNSAGKTIENAVTQSRKVTELMSEIANASNEQTSGIGQINTAVTELDNMTQQNAALVEQNTVSARNLRDHADRLVAAVGVFKLSREETAELYNAVNAAKAEALRIKNAQAAGLQR